MLFAILCFVPKLTLLLIFLQQVHCHILNIREEVPHTPSDCKETHEIDIGEFLLSNIWYMVYCQEYDILLQDQMHLHLDLVAPQYLSLIHI